ncbi:MAG: hypothetical protein ACRDYY_02845, partial [Acidimicrobiales bacterium]
ATPAAPAATPAAPAAAGPSPPPALPSRDELTIAWGDSILPSLRPGVKAYLSAGRFIGVDPDAALYAVPDRGLLARAEPLRPEVEAALAAHFGRAVPLRLVLDDGAGPHGGRGSAPAAEVSDPSEYDVSELVDAEGAVLSPEQRLLEAFPGAEEVPP